MNIAFLVRQVNGLNEGEGVLRTEYTKVARDVLKRLEAGEAKYGSPLMTHNGRSADLDLYQELCDGIAYLTQRIFETTSEQEVLGLIDDCDLLYQIADRCRERLVRDGILT